MSAWDLPITVQVAGRVFAIRSDFRAVLDALAALADPDLTQQEQYIACLQILYPRWKELPDANAALRAAFTFINEGKEDEQQGFRPRLVDWEQDAALIAPAVDKVLGYSCRRCGYLHWWEFLGAFHGIGDGLFAQVASIRNKRAHGKMLDRSVDAVSGSGERAWKLLTLDGTETWSYEGTSVIEKYGFILRTKDIQTPTWPSQKGQIVCNKYATRSANDTYTVHTGISVEAESHKYFRIYDEAYADKGVDAWKAYLAAQYAAGTPVQVCYKLATPVPFTATGGAALSALDGVNTVITDADSVAVSGRADPIKRIADLEAAVASIE